MATKKPVSIPIPVQEVEVVQRIYEAIEKDTKRNFRLSRLGASSIGDECIRKIWLSWRGYDNPLFDGRMLRLFETGNLQEKRIIADLRKAGFSVWERKTHPTSLKSRLIILSPSLILKRMV